MRLTLRTLLAYLDKILDENDARELEQKIQDSDVATQLNLRIQKSLKQRNSKAPAVDANGLGSDANSVSEYLDNTLSPDQIPDFERVCLESDDHLAEVASCHQILTLVLGEPAEVPADLKQRIYQLKDAASTQTSDSDSFAALSSEDKQLRVDARPRPVAAAPARDADERWTEAPDYLKRPRRRRWPQFALTALIVFCLVMAALMGMGPLDSNHPLAKRFGMGTPEQASTTAEASPQDADATLPPLDVPPLDELPAEQPPVEAPPTVTLEQTEAEMASMDEDEPGASLVPEIEAAANAVSLEPPGERAATNVEDRSDAAAGRDSPDGIDLTEPPADPVNATLADDEPASDAPLVLSPPSLDASDALTDDAVSPAVEDLAVNDVTNQEPLTLIDPLSGTLDDQTADAAAPVEPSPEGANLDDPDPENESANLPAVDVGRFLDDKQVLINLNSTSQSWERVANGTRLEAGNVLTSLPTFRTPLMLASGTQVTLIGATRAELRPMDNEQTPIFDLRYGRLLVATFSQTGIRFGLRWGADRTAVITLTDMNTTFAVELHPQHLPGANPEQASPHLLLHIYLTSGSAEWTLPDSPSIQLSAGQRLSLVDDEPAQLEDVADYPLWIDGRDQRPRDPIAADQLSQRLTGDRPITLVLREETESRAREVRSLAACSLAQFGEYAPILVALNEPKLRSYWSAQYRVLADSVGRSSEDAAAAWKAIKQQHGEEDGREFYRILWGYDPAQLQEYGAEQLVTYLDHPSHDFRVAAIESLKQITGLPSLYRAHASEREPQRRAAVARWRKHLNNGEIVYAERPEIVDLLTSSADE